MGEKRKSSEGIVITVAHGEHAQEERERERAGRL